MKIPDLIRLLAEFYSERQALVTRHEAGARLVVEYDFNNTYQNILNREDQHLQWLRGALRDLGASAPESATAPAVTSGGRGPQSSEVIAGDDGRLLGAFVERWRDRIEAVTNARIRSTLRVIVGESLEHQRLFEQAAAGNVDLLGRRTGGPRVSGVGVMPSRWIGD